MSDIVDQRSGPHTLPLFRLQSQAVGQPPGDVTSTNAVFEPTVPGSGIDEVRGGKLLDTPQPLETR